MKTAKEQTAAVIFSITKMPQPWLDRLRLLTAHAHNRLIDMQAEQFDSLESEAPEVVNDYLRDIALDLAGTMIDAAFESADPS